MLKVIREPSAEPVDRMKRKLLKGAFLLALSPVILSELPKVVSAQEEVPSESTPLDLNTLLNINGRLAAVEGLSAQVGSKWEKQAVLGIEGPQTHRYDPEKGNPQGWNFVSARNGRVNFGSDRAYLLGDFQVEPVTDKPFTGIALHNGDSSKSIPFNKLLILGASASGLDFVFQHLSPDHSNDYSIVKRGLASLTTSNDIAAVTAGVSISKDGSEVNVILPDGTLGEPINLGTSIYEGRPDKQLTLGLASVEGSSTTVNKLVVIRNQIVTA